MRPCAADKQFDLVFSGDVLEHILPGQADEVAAELVRVARRHIVMSISLKSHENEALHTTLRPRTWWEALFARHGAAPNRALVWALQGKETGWGACPPSLRPACLPACLPARLAAHRQLSHQAAAGCSRVLARRSRVAAQGAGWRPTGGLRERAGRFKLAPTHTAARMPAGSRGRRASSATAGRKGMPGMAARMRSAW